MQTFQQNKSQEIPPQAPSQDGKVTLQITSNQNSFKKPSLSPFVANTLECNRFVFVSYCQRHNLIIICLCDWKMKFYDATTLLPLEGRKVQELHGYVTSMSYYDETDTFMIGCESGFFYTYNASSEELKQLGNLKDSVDQIVFTNSKFSVLALNREGRLFIADLERDMLYRIRKH